MNLPPEGSGRSDSITGHPNGPEPIVGELTSATVSATPPKPVGWLRKTLKIFGPGLVTGAADDDPSGIATYSSVGDRYEALGHLLSCEFSGTTKCSALY